MGDFASACSAIELPRRYEPAGLPNRRHRPLTGTSGLLLAACFFLPMMRGCEHDDASLELPRVWVPHVYGLVFAIFGLARSRRVLAVGSGILRALGWMVLVGGAAMMAAAPPAGAVELVLGVFLVVAMSGRTLGTTELRMAVIAVLVGAVSAMWFALWAATPDALVGAYLGLASSIGLFAGGMFWLVELAWQPDARLPPAVLRA